MTYCRTIATLSLLVFAAPMAASACRMQHPLVLTDVAYADIVVVGRISNYRLIADQRWREERRQSFYRSGDLQGLIDSSAPAGKFMSDYAQFDIQVDEVIYGQATKTLTVTWNASTFGEPSTMPAGPFLIALRRSTVGQSRAGAPSAAVLHPACAYAFLLPADGASAAGVRLILKGEPLPSSRQNYSVSPVWSVAPSNVMARRYYPAIPRNDEVEGSAAITCIATKGGALTRCTVRSESPRGYQFGAATVAMFQKEVRLKSGTFKPGDTLETIWRWRLD